PGDTVGETEGADLDVGWEGALQPPRPAWSGEKGIERGTRQLIVGRQAARCGKEEPPVEEVEIHRRGRLPRETVKFRAKAPAGWQRSHPDACRDQRGEAQHGHK